ncbi:heavy metal-associated domain, HMA [Artemisia annua]|uniref:Heavy metal-associated domain, HMA n=1 Tax=Artemisia annua TaxID=35608 RepID=A0A2U1NL60_ARTAN|nr:heavy metal-associated domain, HMA [Artemisia annua]
MTKDEDFKLLKIQTCILRVNLHCDGCKNKVKKLLQKIEGVYHVVIDADQQKVTVSGGVDSATLIKKLIRAGKHAELWSTKSNKNQNQSQNNQKQKGSCMKDDKKNKAQKQDFLKTLESLTNQQKFHPLILEEDDVYLDDDLDDEEAENELEIRLLAEQANQVNLLRQQQQQLLQQQQQHAAAVAAANNVKQNGSGNGNGNGQKVTFDQNVGVKMVNNLNNANEVKRVNEMSAIMNNLASFGGASGVGNEGGFGGPGGYQIPQKINNVLGSGGSGFQVPNGGMPMTSGTGGYNPSSQAAAAVMMNMNGAGGSSYNPQQQYNNSAAATASLMMNLQNRQAMQQQLHQQQPQMMYNKAPVIPPTTGYYYSYNPSPYTYNEHARSYYYAVPHGGLGGGDNSAADMFSDENTSSCSIM